MKADLVPWLKTTLPALGGPGIFLSSFVDSSFVPLPLVTDLFLMELSSLHPLRMPLYVAMAAVGSLGGCLLIYWLVRKGGEAFHLNPHGQISHRIQRFVEQHPVACVILPAAAPFPVPFKPFVIAQAVLEVPLVTFLLGTLAGRTVRFFIEGYLAVRYGDVAKEFVLHQKWHTVGIVLGLGVVYFMIRRRPFPRKLKIPQAD